MKLRCDEPRIGHTDAAAGTRNRKRRSEREAIEWHSNAAHAKFLLTIINGVPVLPDVCQIIEQRVWGR